MPESNGDRNREKRLDRLENIAATLLEHARLSNGHLDKHDPQIELLRESVQDTNDSLTRLVSAVRDLIDRIPPENLR